MEDEDLDALAAPAGLDRRRAGVARGGADDGDPFRALGQHVVEQAADQLQGIVLEGQGRTVKQLQHPDAVADLHQRDLEVEGLFDQPDPLAGADPVDERLAHHRADLGQRA